MSTDRITDPQPHVAWSVVNEAHGAAPDMIGITEHAAERYRARVHPGLTLLECTNRLIRLAKTATRMRERTPSGDLRLLIEDATLVAREEQDVGLTVVTVYPLSEKPSANDGSLGSKQPSLRAVSVISSMSPEAQAVLAGANRGDRPTEPESSTVCEPDTDSADEAFDAPLADPELEAIALRRTGTAPKTGNGKRWKARLRLERARVCGAPFKCPECGRGGQDNRKRELVDLSKRVTAALAELSDVMTKMLEIANGEP